MNKHKLWEKLIFADSDIHRVCLLERVLMRFGHYVEAWTSEMSNHVPEAKSIISHRLILLSQDIMRRSFDNPKNGSFMRYLEIQMHDMLSSVPESLLVEVEEALYDELENPEDLNVRWTEARKDEEVRCQCSACQSMRK